MKIVRKLLKNIKSSVLYITASIYIFIIFIAPFQLYKFIQYPEIFPALDLAIIYYINSFKRVQYWHLFIAGLFIDKLYGLPMGINSFSLLVSHAILNYLQNWFVIRKYNTNILLFCVYATLVILLRYLVINILSKNYIEDSGIIFYILTTILSYPIIFLMIEKPLKILEKNNE